MRGRVNAIRTFKGLVADLRLLKRVEVYRIRKEIFEGGYLKPGEQYLQLRYLPGEVK